MSQANNSLDDSGEVVFNPRSCAGSNLSKENVLCDNESTPQHTSAPNHDSENKNEMLRTLRQLSRDLICIKETFGEQLSNIREDTHELFGRVSSLENNRG
jgi:hypothetical protein